MTSPSVPAIRSGLRSLGGALLLIALAGPLSAQSAGLYLEGAGARALAIGGATTASPASPLSALAFNPAGLLGADGWTVVGSLTGSRVSGDYANRVSARNGMGQQFGAIGSLGLSYGSGKAAFGFAAQPINAYLADWEYPDVPGVAEAQYQNADQRALFLNYRLGLGAAYRLSDRLLVGVSGGLVYNRNELDAPYVFQGEPTLSGLKVDVDLVADTWAPNFNAGLLFQALDAMTVGLSWTSATSFEADGDLVGDAGAQFAALGLSGAPPELAYSATVEVGLPQMVSLGIAVDASDRLALFGQLDRVDWGGEFDSLVLDLDDGTNEAVNSLVGDDRLLEESPLEWESRTVSRLGLTYDFDDVLEGRLGYSHVDSPSPDRTLTPLSGLITEHTLSGGLGWSSGPWQAALTYQFELPAERSVGESGLLSGEYSDTRTQVSIHRVSLTVARPF